jgi:ribosomal protein L28
MKIISGKLHMTTANSQPHTSKSLTKSAFLPPVQKKVFLYLANNKPKNINETAKAIKGHYKSVWNAFNELEKKSLIKPVTSKDYHGQEYPRYWVTEGGAFIALCEGAKAQSLIRRTIELYPERRDLHYLLEAVSILGTEAFDVAYWAVVSKGKLEQSDIAFVMATQMQHKLSDEGVEKFGELLQRFPEQQQRFIDFFKEISDNVKDLNVLFKQPKNQQKELNHKNSAE